MSPGSASREPLTVSGVLRAALSLVRRRWFLFAVLAVVLAILPDVLADAAADLDDPAVPAALGGPDGDLADALATAVDTLEEELPQLLAFLFDAAVVAIALRDAVAASGLARSVRRLLPLAVAACLLDAAWSALAPHRAVEVGSALISCWILAAPAWAVERPRLAALPRRLAGLTRDHRRVVATLVIAYAAAHFALARLDTRFLSGFTFGTDADRAATVLGGAAQAALSVLAGTAAAVLYAALRRAQGPPLATLAAFE